MEHVELNGRRVDVFVIADDEDPARAAMFVREAAGYDAVARAALSARYGDEDGDVVLYIEHHAAELGLPNDDSWLATLVLRSINVHPDNTSRMAVFDYTLPNDVTQYVLAVGFDDEGNVVSVDMES